jgi:type II secretory pathway predicted ATPase ExeA
MDFFQGEPALNRVSVESLHKENRLLMYRAHYQLNREAFAMVPDQRFLWTGAQQSRVIETLRDAVLHGDGCVILTGDIGTGKTTLVKQVGEMAGLATVFIAVSGPELSGLDFFHVLAAEFQINRRFSRPEEFIADFTRVLSQAFSGYRKVVLIIDEAQRLTRSALRDLAVLAELQLNGRKPLKLILVGQLELNAVLAPDEDGEVLPKIAARCCLEPLAEEDTRNYIVHRLKTAGRSQPLFSGDAVRQIHALSKGYPRLINIICDHALLYGYSANLQLIEGSVIRDCSRDLSVALDLEESPQDPPASPAVASAGSPAAAASVALSVRLWLYLAAAVAAAGALFYYITG